MPRRDALAIGGHRERGDEHIQATEQCGVFISALEKIVFFNHMRLLPQKGGQRVKSRRALGELLVRP
jgi:hypothetical protein